MQNKTFKLLISWLLIASPLWWTTGCHTTREIAKLDEINREIDVVTKGNRVYTFTAWAYDSLKGISGDALSVARSIRLWDDGEDQNGRLTLQRDNIKSVTLEGEGILPVESLQSIKPKMTTEINVTTKGNNVYFFNACKPDGHGGISGEAEWFDPSSPSWSPDYVQGTTNLPHDSIKSVATKEYSSGRTLLAIFGGTIADVALSLALIRPRLWDGPLIKQREPYYSSPLSSSLPSR
jgi:hypothetical protein